MLQKVRSVFVAGYLLILVFGTASLMAAQEMQVVFQDDFSEGAARWTIIRDEHETIRKENDYLVVGDLGKGILMRIPDIVTNHFDLILDLDLRTGSTDWLAIVFGTTEEDYNPWHYGHGIAVRPTGQVLFFRESEPGRVKDGNTDIISLGWRAPFIFPEVLELRVRPDYVELVTDSRIYRYDGITVQPGYIDLWATNPGPVKLYYIEVSAPVE